MKRVIVTFLVSSLTLSLVGCGPFPPIYTGVSSEYYQTDVAYYPDDDYTAGPTYYYGYNYPVRYYYGPYRERYGYHWHHRHHWCHHGWC